MGDSKYSVIDTQLILYVELINVTSLRGQYN